MVVPLDGGPEALAAALVRLAEDTQFRADLVARGRQWSQRFTWAGHAERVLQVYEMLAQ